MDSAKREMLERLAARWASSQCDKADFEEFAALVQRHSERLAAPVGASPEEAAALKAPARLEWGKQIWHLVQAGANRVPVTDRLREAGLRLGEFFLGGPEPIVILDEPNRTVSLSLRLKGDGDTNIVRVTVLPPSVEGTGIWLFTCELDAGATTANLRAGLGTEDRVETQTRELAPGEQTAFRLPLPAGTQYWLYLRWHGPAGEPQEHKARIPVTAARPPEGE